MIMTGTRDVNLVILSVFVAIFASYTGLSLSMRMRASTGWMRRIWLGSAAVALGGGIWSMHFVAMLAYSMVGMKTSFDWRLTFISFVIAWTLTGAGFAVMDWRIIARWRVIVAGLLMASGVLAMHYAGMAAMHMAADLSYDGWWVGISVMIAIGAAMTAIWLAAHDQNLSHRLLASVFMGLRAATIRRQSAAR